MGREGLPEGRAELHAAGIPAYIFPESAARALNALNRQREWEERPPSSVVPFDVDRDTARAIVQTARGDGRTHLTQGESLAMLRAYGVPIADVVAVATEDALEAAATSVGYPVVMKLASADITHKTDVGGVRVDIGNAQELHAAWREMMASVRAAAPNARVDGVVLQRMVTGGRETIVGISRDPRFGALVMFGLGGVFVEALRDVVFRVAPIDAREARDMLQGIRGARVLTGIRGAAPANEAALVDALCRIAQLGAEMPEIAELDVNPLVALADGVVAVDARVRIGR
jgi:acyl-CoA synthetase (NDP forming)